MKPILILYATREGQTRRIAEHLAAQVRARGWPFELVDARKLSPGFTMESYLAAILSASVHSGRHEKEMVEFVKRHRDGLRKIPSAFVSVSLSQAGVQDPAWTPERRAQAAADTRAMMDKFFAGTGWQPKHVLATAGALRYSQYNWLVRFVMKRIARMAGVPEDTSQDTLKECEFTDWAALDHFAAEVLEEAGVAPLSRA